MLMEHCSLVPFIKAFCVFVFRDDKSGGLLWSENSVLQAKYEFSLSLPLGMNQEPCPLYLSWACLWCGFLINQLVFFLLFILGLRYRMTSSIVKMSGNIFHYLGTHSLLAFPHVPPLVFSHYQNYL